MRTKLTNAVMLVALNVTTILLLSTMIDPIARFADRLSQTIGKGLVNWPL